MHIDNYNVDKVESARLASETRDDDLRKCINNALYNFAQGQKKTMQYNSYIDNAFLNCK